MKQPKHEEEYHFDFEIGLNDLIYFDRGMEDMNDYMDEKFQEHTGNSRLSLTDISYAVQSAGSSNNDIIIRAHGIVIDFDAEMEDCNG